MLEPKGGTCDMEQSLRIVVAASSAIGVSFSGKTYIFCYIKGDAGR
jgi:hypothetical protein